MFKKNADDEMAPREWPFGEVYEIFPMDDYNRRGAAVHSRFAPNREATFALSIIAQHAMISAIPDGEDSSGRQQCRLPTHEEFTKRAFALAKTAFQLMTDEGMMIEYPTLDQIEDMRRENKGRN